MASMAIKIKHPGRLHEALGIPKDKKIPKVKIKKAMHSKDPHMRKMAQFAENASHWKK